jgi:Uncharacterized membrane protein
MKESNAYASIAYFLTRSSFVGMSFHILITYAKQDAWISVLLSYIIGILFICLINNIMKYQNDKSFRDTCISLFPKTYPLIIGVLVLGIFFITVINFGNLGNLVASQFLNKTPLIIIWITFLIPIIYIISKKKIIIARVSLILFYFSIILFIISTLGSFSQIELLNFKPLLQNSIVPSSFTYFGLNIGPLFLITLFPHKEFNKSIWKGYLLSAISLLVITMTIIGTLGYNLSSLYHYPEIHILKNTYQGILNYQLENFLAIQWIFDIFIFCSVGIKWCNEMLTIKEEKKAFILPLLLIMFAFIFFNNLNNSFLPFISNIYFIFFLSISFIFVAKILIKKAIKKIA